MKFRKLASSIAAAGMAAGLLSGCGSGISVSASPTTHTKAAHHAAVESHESPDAAFLSVVRPFMPGYADSQILRIGHLACNALEEDGFAATAMVAMNSGGLSAYDAGQLIGAAVATYCPADLDLLPVGDQ